MNLALAIYSMILATLNAPMHLRQGRASGKRAAIEWYNINQQNSVSLLLRLPSFNFNH